MQGEWVGGGGQSDTVRARAREGGWQRVLSVVQWSYIKAPRRAFCRFSVSPPFFPSSPLAFRHSTRQAGRYQKQAGRAPKTPSAALKYHASAWRFTREMGEKRRDLPISIIAQSVKRESANRGIRSGTTLESAAEFHSVRDTLMHDG